MERKGGSAAVVTAEAVTTGLQKSTVTSTEEKALRMRYGASVDLKAPLPTAHGDNEELGDELLLLEMRLLSALKRQRAMAKAPTTVKNATKSKIVASLKSKKK